MNKILITGGVGFIGSQVVNILSQTNKYKITVLDAMPEQIHVSNHKKSYLYNKIKDKCEIIIDIIKWLKMCWRIMNICNSFCC